jgi:replicative DNA helicase
MTTTPTTAERMPPNAMLAEQSTLGCMLRDNETIPEVMAILTSPSFYQDGHQKVFRGIVALHEAHGPANLVTLAEWLRQRHYIDDVGGYGYLADLWETTPTGANAGHYAKMVREKSLCRSLIHVCNDIMVEAYDQNGPADELVAAAEAKMLQVASRQAMGQTTSLANALNMTIDNLDVRAKAASRNDRFLSYGYLDLDEKTAGLHPGELTIVAARPSVGKTSLALNILSHLSVDLRLPTLMCSLEQSRIEIGERLLSMHAGVSCHAIRKAKLTDGDVDAIEQATERIHQAPLTIDDSPNQNLVRIGANARRMRRQERIRCLAVDYLQLIEPDNKRDNRNEQIGVITRRLKCLARELEIPVIVLCQLSREAAKQERPQLHHLRDSGNIEQDADSVLLLYRPEESHGCIEVDVAKQRNGPTGRLTLSFNNQLMRFTNYAPEIGNV